MSKKILAILMAVAMAFSLLPATALATTSGDDQQQSTLEPGAKYYNFDGTETTSENPDITLTKTAAPVEREDDVYEVTLTATTSQKVTPKPVEVVFVLDGSGSMGWCTENPPKGHIHYNGGWCLKTMAKKNHSKSRWNIAINAINQMVQNIGEDGVTYKYVLFSSDAEIVTSYDKNTKPEGYTNLTEGVEKGIATFSKNSGADKVMIIVADGESNDGYPAKQATAFKNAGGKIYTVGFLFSGNKFNNLSSGDGYHFTADNADQINLAMNTITQNIAGLISDPMGQNVALLQDKGISVKLGDLDTTAATVLNGNTIRWTKTDGFSGTVTMKYKVQVKDSAKTGKVLSIPLNANATFNYVHNGTSHSVAFPQPAAQAAALTVSYKVGDETVKTEEDYTLLGETAAFTKTIPSVGDAVEIEGKTYYVSSTDGSVPEQLASAHYQVTVNLSEKPTSLGAVTVTVSDKTVPYNGEVQRGNADDSISGLPKGYTLSTTYTPAEGTDANAEGYEGTFGDVTITRDSDQADVTSRFTITTTPGKLIINKREVTVKADNQSKVYGAENPELTYTASGFVEGESLDTLGITPRLTTEAVKNSPVGSYPITFSNPTAETDNYTIKYENATLTIGRSQTLVGTVSLGDWKYGEEQQTETWNVNGGDNDYDAPTYSYKVKGAADSTYTNVKPSNAGEYTVKATWVATPNCPEISATANFEIYKRNVTLTSATARKSYDGKPLTNDEITVGDDGFAQGEGATYHVTGTQTEPNESFPTSNTFTYELKKGTLQSNYNITKVEGTLTVTGSATVTVDLSKLIQKELKLKEESSLPQNATFKVKVTEAKDGATPIVGETESTSSWTGDGPTYTVPFTFANNLTLEKGKNYSYQVTEDTSDPVSGVEYDPTTYQLKIEAKMDGTYSASYTVAPTGDATEATTTDVTEETPLTIKNTYQTPDLSVTKEPYKVNDTLFDADKTVAHVNDKIIWSVTVKNNGGTTASTTLTETLTGAAVYSKEEFTDANKVQLDTNGTWMATVSAGETKTYYVTYEVKANDIPNGKIVNTIVMKNGDQEKAANSDPVSTWDTKQLKSATKLDTSDWTTTVTLELPTVNGKEEGTPVITSDAGQGTEVKPDPIAVKSGSYVIDQIGNEFTFVPELTLKVGKNEYTGVKDGDTNTYNFGIETGGAYPYTVTYDATKTPAQFTWNINENVYAGTKVTLSYKLKLTTPKTAAGTYGVEDLNGNGQIEQGKTPIYTNESATLYKDANTKLAEFPKPSVSYTIKSSSGSHSGGSRPSLNTKDHYGYIIGYPVDYYTGQPTTDQTKKPVRPEGKITRAEVATIYFRMLTDESRTKFWSQNSGYSDVKTGDWFNNAVSTLSNAGIIAGYEDGSFRPNGYITRAEFATIAARFFDVTYNGKDLFPDISGHWAKDYINQAANKGFVNGYEDGTFKPDRNITRAEAVTLVNRTLDRHPDKNHFTKDMLVWPDNMDQTKWYYADMQEATNSHTYQMKENSDKTKYENWTKTLPIRNWEALEKAWSNANSSQGNGNVV